MHIQGQRFSGWRRSAAVSTVSDGLSDQRMFKRSLKDDSLLFPARNIDIIIMPPMDPMTIPNIKSIITVPPPVNTK